MAAQNGITSYYYLLLLITTRPKLVVKNVTVLIWVFYEGLYINHITIQMYERTNLNCSYPFFLKKW